MMVMRWILMIVVTCGMLLPTTAFGRVWRDHKGKMINADFVKVEGGMIYLKPENKYAAANPFPFYDFSEADQEFVKAILKKKGQLDRIPPPPPAKDDANGKANQPGQANVGAVPIAVVANVPARTSGNDNGFFPSPINSPINSTGNSPINSTGASPVIDRASPTLPIAVTPAVTPAAQPAFTPPAIPRPNFRPTPMPTPSPGFAPSFGPQHTEIKQCLSCQKEIPLSSQVGQKCPHCGVYWSAEQNEFGQVTKTAPGSFSDGSMLPRGAIRLAFLIGAFVIGGIAKLVHDNK